MTFEDWLDEYLKDVHPDSEWITEDVREAWNAGWDACNDYLARGGTFR